MRTIAHPTMTRIAVQAVVASLTIIYFALSAPAVPLTWTINNATFDDGGTLAGSFVFNADTNIYSSFNIRTAGPGSNPTFFPPFTYSPATSTIIAGDANSLHVGSTNHLVGGPVPGTIFSRPERELRLNYIVPGNLTQRGFLTNAGGTLLLTSIETGRLQTGPLQVVTDDRVRGEPLGSIESTGSPSSGAPEPPSAASMMLGLSVIAISFYLKRSRHLA